MQITRSQTEKIMKLEDIETQTFLAEKIGCTKEHFSVMFCEGKLSKKFSKELCRVYPSSCKEVIGVKNYESIIGKSPRIKVKKRYLSYGEIRKKAIKKGISLRYGDLKYLIEICRIKK